MNAAYQSLLDRAHSLLLLRSWMRWVASTALSASPLYINKAQSATFDREHCRELPPDLCTSGEVSRGRERPVPVGRRSLSFPLRRDQPRTLPRSASVGAFSFRPSQSLAPTAESSLIPSIPSLSQVDSSPISIRRVSTSATSDSSAAL